MSQSRGRRKHDLSRLLRPSSIALFGGKEVREVIRQCRKLGYEGEIWPLHPKHSEVEGLKCYASLADLPAPPDASFLAINRKLTLEIAGDLAAMGAGGVICYASGFREVGAEGAQLQEALIKAAGSMPLLGPNCYGMINYLDGALLWPDQHGGQRLERGVAIISQSGNMGINFSMQRRGLPLAYLASLGNQAQLGHADMIEALLEDERVTAIGLHVEGFSDPQAFARAAEKARAKKVPILVLKTGRSEMGAALAMSHTASIAGSGEAAEAFMKRLGVGVVETVPAFIETLKLLHLFGPIKARKLVSMSCSGGEASLMADSVERYDLTFPQLTPSQVASVQATLSDLVHVSNPLDYHTFIWADRQRMADCFAAMLQCEVDFGLLVLDFPRVDRASEADWLIAVEALVEAVHRSGTAAGILASLPESLPETWGQHLTERGLGSFGGVEEALTALETASDMAESWARASQPLVLLGAGIQEGATTNLNEFQAKQMLKGYGLPVPRSFLLSDLAQLDAGLGDLSFPLVAKACGSELTHKSELGAVRLGLRDPQELRLAVEALLPLSGQVLIEEMVQDAVAEFLIGVTHDPSFGHYLLVGSGGLLVELLKDAVVVLPDDAPEVVLSSLKSLKGFALLEGFRGKSKGDIPALLAAVQAVQSFVSQEAGRLVELDVNPVMVRPEGSGVVAVDALVRLREAVQTLQTETENQEVLL